MQEISICNENLPPVARQSENSPLWKFKRPESEPQWSTVNTPWPGLKRGGHFTITGLSLPPHVVDSRGLSPLAKQILWFLYFAPIANSIFQFNYLEFQVVFVLSFCLTSTPPSADLTLHQKSVHYRMLSRIKIKRFRALRISLRWRVLHLRKAKNSGVNLNCLLPHHTNEKRWFSWA